MGKRKSEQLLYGQLQKLASDVPATRAHLVPLLRKYAAGFSITDGGLVPAQKADLKPNTIHYLGASSSPKLVIVVNVTDNVIEFLDSHQDYKKQSIERWIGEDLIARGDATAAKDRRSRGEYAPGASVNPKKWVKDMEVGYVYVEGVPGAPHPQGDAWYTAELYGGVGGLDHPDYPEDSGILIYEIRIRWGQMSKLKKDRRLKIVKDFAPKRSRKFACRTALAQKHTSHHRPQPGEVILYSVGPHFIRGIFQGWSSDGTGRAEVVDLKDRAKAGLRPGMGEPSRRLIDPRMLRKNRSLVWDRQADFAPKRSHKFACRTAVEDILSPGQVSNHPEVKKFLADMEHAFRKHFPKGFFSGQASHKFGRNAIMITTALLPEGQQRNGILQNDPHLARFSLHDSYTDLGMAPQVRIERFSGKHLFGPSGSFERVGWRNGTGKPEGAVRKFDRYFAKLRLMVDRRDDIEA